MTDVPNAWSILLERLLTEGKSERDLGVLFNHLASAQANDLNRRGSVVSAQKATGVGCQPGAPWAETTSPKAGGLKGRWRPWSPRGLACRRISFGMAWTGTETLSWRAPACKFPCWWGCWKAMPRPRPCCPCWRTSAGCRPIIPSGSMRLSMHVTMAMPAWAMPSKPRMSLCFAYSALASSRSSNPVASAWATFMGFTLAGGAAATPERVEGWEMCEPSG